MTMSQEVVEAREARQGLGWSSMPVLAVLAISTLLAVVALGVVFLSLREDDDVGPRSANSKAVHCGRTGRTGAAGRNDPVR